MIRMTRHARPFFALLAVGVALGGVVGVPNSALAQPALPCSLARITSIKMPVGPAKYQSGTIRLSNGASLQLTGSRSDPAVYPVTRMRLNDQVAACYSRVNRYADAGPSRTITILDRRTSGFYGSLIGTWPL